MSNDEKKPTLTWEDVTPYWVEHGHTFFSQPSLLEQAERLDILVRSWHEQAERLDRSTYAEKRSSLVSIPIDPAGPGARTGPMLQPGDAVEIARPGDPNDGREGLLSGVGRDATGTYGVEFEHGKEDGVYPMEYVRLVPSRGPDRGSR